MTETVSVPSVPPVQGGPVAVGGFNVGVVYELLIVTTTLGVTVTPLVNTTE